MMSPPPPHKKKQKYESVEQSSASPSILAALYRTRPKHDRDGGEIIPPFNLFEYVPCLGIRDLFTSSIRFIQWHYIQKPESTSQRKTLQHSWVLGHSRDTYHQLKPTRRSRTVATSWVMWFHISLQQPGPCAVEKPANKLQRNCTDSVGADDALTNTRDFENSKEAIGGGGGSGSHRAERALGQAPQVSTVPRGANTIVRSQIGIVKGQTLDTRTPALNPFFGPFCVEGQGAKSTEASASFRGAMARASTPMASVPVALSGFSGEALLKPHSVRQDHARRRATKLNGARAAQVGSSDLLAHLLLGSSFRGCGSRWRAPKRQQQKMAAEELSRAVRLTRSLHNAPISWLFLHQTSAATLMPPSAASCGAGRCRAARQGDLGPDPTRQVRYKRSDSETLPAIARARFSIDEVGGDAS